MRHFFSLSPTVFSYLFIKYIRIICLTTLGLASFIAFIEIIELIRRVSDKSPDLSAMSVIGISLLNLPSLIDQILPFGVLFGSMICFYFWRRHHEFLITRVMGQNIWQALAPVIISVFCLGIVHIMIINPIAATASKQYNYYINAIFGENSTIDFSVLTNGIWLRDQNIDTHFIINGQALEDNHTVIDPIIYQTAPDGKINWYIQAASMKLSDEGWILHDAIHTDNQGTTHIFDQLVMPTKLRPSDLLESKLPPKTVNIYRLPSYISVRQRAGLPVNQHRVFFHQVLSTPIKLVGLALLAAAFSLAVYERQTKIKFILFGIGSGFFIYFLSDTVYLLGRVEKLPYLIAGWSPALLVCMLSGFLLIRVDE